MDKFHIILLILTIILLGVSIALAVLLSESYKKISNLSEYITNMQMQQPITISPDVIADTGIGGDTSGQGLGLNTDQSNNMGTVTSEITAQPNNMGMDMGMDTEMEMETDMDMNKEMTVTGQTNGTVTTNNMGTVTTEMTGQSNNMQDINIPANTTFVNNQTTSTNTNITSQSTVSIKPTTNDWTREHNRIRALVGQKPVKWNAKIAKGAQKHANKCKVEHSTSADRQFGNVTLGENLAWGSPYDAYSDVKMIQMWDGEKLFYDHPQRPGQSKKGETGHYTQMVNKNVTEIGCGCSKCTDGSKFCVCRYNPIQMGNEFPY